MNEDQHYEKLLERGVDALESMASSLATIAAAANDTEADLKNISISLATIANSLNSKLKKLALLFGAQNITSIKT